MKYDLIIGIDPAGIGNNGIVIYSNETNNIIFNETFNTLTVLWTKNIYKEKFQLIKEQFINKKILVIVENFFLSSKQLLTNPFTMLQEQLLIIELSNLLIQTGLKLKIIVFLKKMN
ncbi:hypothetical protein [Spiroplasma endosymbiont of Dactylopius coccus]